jgi:alpha-N-arabinofuranosidase
VVLPPLSKKQILALACCFSWIEPMKAAATKVLFALSTLMGIHPSPGNPAPPSVNKLVIHADKSEVRISRNIYGQFAEHLGRGIYGGLWVGEDSPIPNTRGIRNDVVTALRRLKVPVLRWPGGCFADEYHWKDGIGPREQRPPRINTHWGGVVENNHFGTHEFLDLCEQLGCDAYICANLGSGTVQELMEWVEYMTSDADSLMVNLRRKNGREKPWKIPYLGLGNESWGCGGNMNARFYADNFCRYNNFVKNYAGNQVYRIACGANADDYKWTEVVAGTVGEQMDGLSLHYYTVSGGSATRFTESDWLATLLHALEIDEILTQHAAILEQQVTRKRVGLIVDEWGAWHEVEPGTHPKFLYQQNSLRDALLAGSTLNILNNHARWVKMANISEMINVLQAMILTRNEKLILTPTYHVFEMYAVHQDAKLLPTEVRSADYQLGPGRIPTLNVSASRDKAGKIHVTLCNLNPHAPAEVDCELDGARPQRLLGRLLTAPELTAHNTFEQPDHVAIVSFDAGQITARGFVTTLPAKSVVALELE